MAEIVIQQTEAGEGNFYKFAPDVYEAEVAEIEEVDNPFEDDKTQLQFRFNVPGYTNEDGSVASVRGWANPVWNAKSKLWKWASAITGQQPEKGAPFRTSMLIGKPCRVVMNADVNQKGEPVVKLTDVLATKNGVVAPPMKKPGLVAQVKAGKVPGVVVAEDANGDPVTIDQCCVPGCTKMVDKYDADGNAFCTKHAPDDE